MIVRKLRGCEVWLWPRSYYLETRYSDGTVVKASPEDTASYHRRARECGYRGPLATWHLCRDHEISHSLLAEARGMPFSPALWAVAHGEPPHTEANGQEEWVTLSFQHWCVTGDLYALEVLEMHGFTIDELTALKARLREFTTETT